MKLIPIIILFVFSSCESFMLSPLIVRGIENNNDRNYNKYKYKLSLTRSCEDSVYYYTNRKYKLNDKIE